MARPGISYEDILQSITILEAQGNTPSINSVRDTLGRGSPTTISTFLKQWREEQVEVKTIPQEKIKVSKATDLDSEHVIQNTKPRDRVEVMSKTEVKPNFLKTSVTDTQDPMIQALLASSQALSSDILSSMSEEWSVVLNENNPELKVRKLYAALVKEQTRRESSEQVAKEARIYAETLKEQTTQRISDLRDALEGQIAFLNGQIRQLKRESEKTLEYYRKQLEKSNNVLAEKKCY